MKYLNWNCKISFCTFILWIFVLNSCTSDSPYPEFESNLKRAICKCVKMGKTLSKEQILPKYGHCIEATSKILKTGLDPYQEHPAISKEEYLEKLPELINKLKTQCSHHF